MKRVLLLVAVAVPVLAAAVYSRQQSGAAPAGTTAPPDLKVAVEEKNPWTSLKVNRDPDQFQFAIVTDRTGGHRAKVFSRAVYQLNLLQPEFVVTVGDLIEGYTTKEDRIRDEWKEFEGYVKQLQMPFFYVPGNHDLATKELIADWGGRYGRKYYHFLYKNVLFLAVNSEEPGGGRIGEEQRAYFKKALDDNPGVRWTMVFLHRPLWTQRDVEKTGWLDMEKLLAGRKYTVFCGHIHHYQKFVRNGMNYYQLATTGGGSKLRGVKYGEFDHVSWVTMKKDGPLIANVMLDGVLPEDLQIPDTEEKGVQRKTAPTQPVKGRVTFQGKPADGATVRFWRPGSTRMQVVADALTGEDGAYLASTNKPFDGIPAGEYTVTVVQTGEYARGDVKGKNRLPAKYADPKTSGLKVMVKEGENEIDLDLNR